MRIEINNSKVINVVERNLVVKGGKLFNTDTREYEAIDGDRITFPVQNGSSVRWIHGTVDGYTCFRRIKLKGVDDLYASRSITEKKIEHTSTITDSDCDGVYAVEHVESDWDIILKKVD